MLVFHALMLHFWMRLFFLQKYNSPELAKLFVVCAQCDIISENSFVRGHQLSTRVV